MSEYIMRILWVVVLISGIAGLLPAPQSVRADETEQPRQLDVAVGMQSFTTRYKISLEIDEKLKPGDYVTIYDVAHIKVYKSGSLLIQDVWITDAVAQNLRVIAIDRTETLDPNQPYVLRMVRLEISPRDRIGSIRNRAILRPPGAISSIIERTIGLTGDDPPNICGDCIVFSLADYKAKYGRECRIRIRKGGEVVYMTIPCPNR